MSRPRSILVLAVTAQAAVSVVQFGLPAIGVEVRDQLGLGPAGFGAVFAAIGLGSAVALIPGGMLVDRFGARPVLLGGAGLSALGYLGAALAGGAAQFAAALFVVGVGSASVPVAGMSALLREFPADRRGVALGWRQLAVPLGGTVGAIVLPLLAQGGGVRLALACAGTATTITAIWFALLSPTARGETRSLRLDGVLSAAGMRPLLGLALLYSFALGASLTYLVPAARDAGLVAAQAAALFTALNVSAGASRLFWGRLADRDNGRRRGRTLSETGGLTAVAALLTPLAVRGGVAPALVATVLLAFGAFGFNGVLYVTAGELAGPERAGRAVGVASTVVFGACALAAPLAGLVAERFGYDAMWLIAACCSAAGAMLARRRLAGRPVELAEEQRHFTASGHPSPAPSPRR